MGKKDDRISAAGTRKSSSLTQSSHILVIINMIIFILTCFRMILIMPLIYKYYDVDITIIIII